MVFSTLFEAFLVNLELPSKLFLCSDVMELWSSRKFQVAFSSLKVLAKWVQQKVRGHEVALFSLENYRGRFLYRKFQETFFNNNRNILILKCEQRKLRKSQLSYQKTSEYFTRMKRLSRNFQLFLSFRNFQAIFAPSNSYFAEKSRQAPLIVIKRKSPQTSGPNFCHLLETPSRDCLKTNNAECCNDDQDVSALFSCSRTLSYTEQKSADLSENQLPSNFKRLIVLKIPLLKFANPMD